MSGKTYLSPAEQERIFSFSKRGGEENNDPFSLLRNLTDRQLQIFSLIGKGLGTAEIAVKLKLSSKTVDAHKENIKTKIRCDSSQLRQFAIEWNNR
jgi:DNA-binding NarL/FixJ family response regulator